MRHRSSHPSHYGSDDQRPVRQSTLERSHLPDQVIFPASLFAGTAVPAADLPFVVLRASALVKPDKDRPRRGHVMRHVIHRRIHRAHGMRSSIYDAMKTRCSVTVDDAYNA